MLFSYILLLEIQNKLVQDRSELNNELFFVK